MAQIIKLFPGDVVECKKPHPCGGNAFRIVRVGSICRVICVKCGRDMSMDRVRLEKAIKQITTTNRPPETQQED